MRNSDVARGLILALTLTIGCNRDESVAPLAPSADDSPAKLIVLSNVGSTPFDIPDTVRDALSGAVPRASGGTGAPGIARRVMRGAHGELVVSEVTRDGDGRISGLQTSLNGVVLLRSQFRVQGLRISGAVLVGNRIQESVEGPLDLGARGDPQGPVAFAESGGGDGDPCTWATLNYLAAVATLATLVLTLPLDPTPAQVAMINLASALVQIYQVQMNEACGH